MKRLLQGEKRCEHCKRRRSTKADLQGRPTLCLENNPLFARQANPLGQLRHLLGIELQTGSPGLACRRFKEQKQTYLCRTYTLQ
eukprot:1136474-Pelagomonas_calceolata.AAC.5